MAATAFDGLSDAQIKLWERSTWMHAVDESFFFAKGFVAANDQGRNYPIHRVTTLSETERGLECVMQLVQHLTADGVVGDNELEGNEEALVNDAQTIRIDQLRHACRSRGKMSEQATQLNFLGLAKEELGIWLGQKLDELASLTISGRAYTLKLDGSTRGSSQLPSLSFAADVAAASTNRIVHAGSATSEGTLTTSDKMTWNLIVKARALAERKRLKPIKDRGKGYYAMVMSPEAYRDLCQDSTFQTIMRSAAERGSKNPLFAMAEVVVSGVVIHVHNKVYTTLGATSGAAKWGSGNTVDGSQAIMLGAGALGFAAIGAAKSGALDSTDYQNRRGVSLGRMIGFLKPRFKNPDDSNSREDFGVISVKTAAAATV